MKELVLKRRSELEEICREAHIEPDMSTAQEKLFAMIDSGGVFFFLCPMKLKVIDLRLLLMLFACRPCGCVWTRGQYWGPDTESERRIYDKERHHGQGKQMAGCLWRRNLAWRIQSSKAFFDFAIINLFVKATWYSSYFLVSKEHHHFFLHYNNCIFYRNWYYCIVVFVCGKHVNIFTHCWIGL